MEIERVLETCLYVDDLAAAEDFYSRVLGLEVHSRKEGRHIFFRCGPGMFLVFNAAQSARPGGSVPAHGAHGPGHVAFAVPIEHLAAWQERLRRHEVAVEAELTWPGGGRSLYFRDPAGNSVELATPQLWSL